MRIEIRQSWGSKSLYINGYPQTQSSYLRDWKTIFRRAGVGTVRSVLLLGLGGGDVIKLLTNYQNNVAITVVELESEVVEIAQKYFGIMSNPKLKIVVDDAQKYMGNNHAKYDLVVVDLYSGDDIPEFVGKPRFLNQIAGALATRGKAIFNYASHSFTQKDFSEFEQKLWRVFSAVKKLKTWGHTYYLVTLASQRLSGSALGDGID